MVILANTATHARTAMVCVTLCLFEKEVVLYYRGGLLLRSVGHLMAWGEGIGKRTEASGDIRDNPPGPLLK